MTEKVVRDSGKCECDQQQRIIKKKNPICPVKHVQLDYAQLGPFIWGARFYSHSETEGRKTQK